jgi:NADPH-dependent 2,4-dienoyl-CoA reductase/sulfur reductase-like enzyme
MTHFKYLIVGGGMTAAAAVNGIREVDRTGSVGVISADSDPPYARPPLSKGLWKGERASSIWLLPRRNRLKVILERVVTGIAPEKRQVTDDKGAVYTYTKLLLATGGRPRRLPFGHGQILYYRTWADYQRLRGLTKKGRKFAVIGAGFIGSEIAAALAMTRKKVVLIFPGKEIGSRIFPKELSTFVSGVYRKRGVQLLAGEEIVEVKARGKQSVVTTKKHRDIVVDGVVAGVGIEPNVELAKSMGLKVNDGILVDEFLRTSHPHIYAAGDVAAFRNPALGRRIRVEHEDNANTMGRAAGRNMAGRAEPYDHLPFFYSDLFDLGYEAVGELDSSLETFADWKRPNKEGVVYYLKKGRVRGVLLWNVWDQVDAARALIAEPGPFTRKNLKGKLPEPAAGR